MAISTPPLRNFKQWEDSESMKKFLGGLVDAKKKRDYLTDTLSQIGVEPMFYQLNDAYLIITLTEILQTECKAWKLFRKWGIIDGQSNQANQIFFDYSEARRLYDIIIRDKKRKGYKAIF